MVSNWAYQRINWIIIFYLFIDLLGICLLVVEEEGNIVYLQRITYN